MGIDSDYAWLKTHLNFSGTIDTRMQLVQRVVKNLTHRVENGRLPYTLGVFGGWGTGKTTFLAMLAKELEGDDSCKVVDRILGSMRDSWKLCPH